MMSNIPIATSKQKHSSQMTDFQRTQIRLLTGSVSWLSDEYWKLSVSVSFSCRNVFNPALFFICMAAHFLIFNLCHLITNIRLQMLSHDPHLQCHIPSEVLL